MNLKAVEALIYAFELHHAKTHINTPILLLVDFKINTDKDL